MYLGESTVVPDVAVVGEAVADKPQAALLDVLLDGVEGLLLGDFHLCVGPARNLNNHIQDSIILVSEKRNVMEWGDDISVLLDKDAMVYHEGSYEP